MISTKGRYALRVLIDLSQQGTEVNVPLKDIARRQGISKKYLEAIARELVSGGFIAGTGGPGGGYRLCRPPQELNIGEILECMEGTLATVACLVPDAKPCPREAKCETLPMWREFDSIVHDFFYSRTILDLLQGAVPTCQV